MRQATRRKQRAITATQTTLEPHLAIRQLIGGGRDVGVLLGVKHVVADLPGTRTAHAASWLQQHKRSAASRLPSELPPGEQTGATWLPGLAHCHCDQPASQAPQTAYPADGLLDIPGDLLHTVLPVAPGSAGLVLSPHLQAGRWGQRGLCGWMACTPQLWGPAREAQAWGLVAGAPPLHAPHTALAHSPPA